MAFFKCKMCGGELVINGERVLTCEYCGTQQTLPRLDDDKRANLYDRASHFRRNNEFDKAMTIYEQILTEDRTDAEAYWSIILCRYGIEYVEDPVSHKRIPTVNRAQFTSVLTDEDYQSALQYADEIAKTVYEEEAKAIDEIQKGILAISQKEEPFDIFICYKETDERGRRTPDSVYAQELYNALTKDGFKVFFSRITLEDKLGEAYEPYIFAALNSAKVMVVVGTKQEYFNATWVKNEWSRYLALIKQGQEKTLIPAYKDVDPYSLPEEFAYLQAQDMGKLGFMQDMLRGINKIIGANRVKPATTVVYQPAQTDVHSVLEEAFAHLKNGEFEDADVCLDEVLNTEYRNARAYVGKLMIELRVREQANLAKQRVPFDQTDNFRKAIRFGDVSLVKELRSYIDTINARIEYDRIDAIYVNLCRQMHVANSRETYVSLAEEFQKISTHRDSAALATQCNEQAEQIAKEEEQKRIENEKRKKRIRKIALISLTAVLLVAITVAVSYKPILNHIKYQEAIEFLENGQVDKAYNILIDIADYKPAEEKTNEIKNNALSHAKTLASTGNYGSAYRHLQNLCPDETQLIKAYKAASQGDYTKALEYGLSEIVLSEDLTTINENAFKDCTTITSITIPNSVTNIGNSAFSGCTSLTSIVIPNSVTSIPNRMCYSNPVLRSIVIPRSITEIGNQAFSYCSNLDRIYYFGTAGEWNQINISFYGNGELLSATRYYYSATQPTVSGNYWHYVGGVPTPW